MKQLRLSSSALGFWTVLGALAAIVGCAGHFGGARSSNADLTMISFGSLYGETAECG